MEAVKPFFELTIAGKNITGDVSAFLSSVEYTDKLEEASDEVQLVFDDISALWHSDWYPQQGDTLSLKMGYKGNMLDCGEFEIDEIELTGQPDILTVKAIAAAISKELRTRNSKGYEKQTLRQIAQYIATKNGLKITGDTSKINNIKVGRKTQHNETDLAFLTKLAKKYGIIFSVRGKQLVFLNPEDLEKNDAIASFQRSQLSTYSFKDKTSDTYESASVSQRDSKTNSVVNWKKTVSGQSTKADELIVDGRAEDDSQAEASAQGALREKNKDKLTGSFSTDGNPLLVAGVNVEMESFGGFSGKWTVKESKHSISVESGYITTVEIRKGPYKKTFQPSTGGTTNWSKTIGMR